MLSHNRRLLVFLVGVLLPILACTLPGTGAPTETPSPQPPGNVETSVALTVQAERTGGQTDQTSTPEVTFTPTLTSTITPTATSSVTTISVSVATNCRYGPGIIYDPPVTVFNVGETAQVYGVDPNGDFYYIDKGCWVWKQYVTVQSGSLAGLPVFTPPPTPTYTPTSEPGPWEGTWVTDCGISNCQQMILEQDGNSVTGTYAGGAGEIEGTVSGNHLVGTWKRNNTSGSIDFWMDPDQKRWRGNYGRTNGWCGWRQGQSKPSPCSVASWYGTWQTNCGLSNCGEMELEQNGLSVSGTYANGDGTVDGTVDGRVFSGTWTRNNTSGPFTFYMLSNGTQFQGNYNTTFAWCGYRDGAGDPSPCLKN